MFFMLHFLFICLHVSQKSDTYFTIKPELITTNGYGHRFTVYLVTTLCGINPLELLYIYSI